MKIHFNPGSAAISRRTENQGFRCERCRTLVVPLTNGSYRNHCPACLYSTHVDLVPGDRAATCGGLMRPVGLDHRAGKGWVLVHRCEQCRLVRTNRLAVDTTQPDDLAALARLGPAR